MPFVIQSGSKQYVVTPNQEVIVDSLVGTNPGDEISVDLVYGYGDEKGTKAVKAQVVKHFKGKKVRVVKFRAKSTYYRRYGMRQHQTLIKILPA